MKEQEIIEGNKLIAKFMGGLIHARNATKIWVRFDDKDFVRLSTLKYNKNWNSLMPVIEKLNTSIPNLDKSIYVLEQKDCFWDLKITSDINIVYKAVVEFIKWYNENK